MAPERRAGLGLLALYLAISLAWSWPLPLHLGDLLVTRHFDGFAALWLMEVAPDLDLGQRSLWAAWPRGQVLRRADSQLLVMLSRVLVPVTGPVVLFNLIVLLGPVATAWGAERFAADTLGARRPWSGLAGLSFAFCGLSATSILEGHAYFLLLPWLPLLARHWWKATGPEGTLRDGALAGLHWVLCLLTSGYVGVLGVILVLVGLPRALPDLRRRMGPLGAAAALALPLGLFYTVAFVTGADEGARFHTEAPVLGQASEAGIGATAAQLQAGSSGLLQLVALRLSDDGVRHAIAPVLSLTALVLALFAGRVLPRGPWRTFQVLGVVGALLSLGPFLELIDGPLHSLPALERLLFGAPEPGAVGGGPPWAGFPNLPGLLFPLAFVEGDVFLHFPYRFAWLSALGFGGVAAAVATRLADDLGPKRWLVLGLLGAGVWDAAVRPLVPMRTAAVPLTVPAAYTALAQQPPRGVLELWPRPVGGATDADLRMNNLTCTYQRTHQWPLVSDCIGTGLAQSPRVRVTRWFFAQVYDEASPDTVRTQLQTLGIGAIAVHPLLFSEDQWTATDRLLRAALGPPVASSEDAGDPVWLYAVQGASDRDAARAGWAALAEAGW